ncbi:MAG: hypothetical protein L6R35_004909 [Caloplaca aegaea]|nr:MAG: hypothetical protein L6R35_004909 [Caloplaca aegaea]
MQRRLGIIKAELLYIEALVLIPLRLQYHSTRFASRHVTTQAILIRGLMPKGAARGGSSKKPVKSQDKDDDGSNIVFEHDGPKKPRKSGPNESSVKSKESATDPPGQEAPKRPDTRQIVGGASWTGKLPVNILSEHCQKQKWGKPEYTITKTANGFSSSVILKSIDPKTKESISLPPFVLPPSYRAITLQATAIEARHFAATYALFRVCSMRNIHMMLPPTFRNFWKNEFEQSKKEDTKAGRAWMYAADPFIAQQAQTDTHALGMRKRAEDEQHRQDAKQTVNLSLGSARNGISKNTLTSKTWAKAPTVEMGKQVRSHIENLVQQNGAWNPHAAEFPRDQIEDAVMNLAALGFRTSHAEEAIAECKDREEALEWLLIHVPEDDLPRWSLPEGYTAGISMASGNPKRDAVVARLAEAGYSTDLCSKTLDIHGGDEERTAAALQKTLVNEPDTPPADEPPYVSGPSTLWREEQMTLDAIFGERLSAVSETTSEIQLDTQDLESCILRVRGSHMYPQSPPVMAIVSPRLPAYVRLSILRQLLEYTRGDLLGEPMVFNLVDWVESHVTRIIENPGRLRDVTSAITGLPHENNVSKTRRAYHSATPKSIVWKRGTLRSVELHNLGTARQETAQQQKMLAARRKLPAWSQREAIVQTVIQNQVTIISGETGSGKSTQSVQFILDDMIQRQLGSCANVICTQPRRISALGLADRVSEERCSTVGDEVGYAIRGESKIRAGQTKITFVTTGVLLRRLQTTAGQADDLLAALGDVSHVVIDEVHERSLDTDFLLILLRSVLPKRRDLKVVLMSATLEAAVFEDYFNQCASVGKCNIEGRTFPVEDVYLDDIVRFTGYSPRRQYHDDEHEVQEMDPNVAHTIQSLGMKINYDLIASCIESIDHELGAEAGGILIFLPGVVEITRTLDAIRKLSNMHALPLHASLLPSEQRRVFPPPPRGTRKVIAATNVAETSITIEDIVAVVDCGKVKETSFDPQNNMVRLEEVWASRAACKQRRGRAGRVRPGTCYKLYTRNAEAKMAERPEPEIRRVPLEQLCLSVKAMGIHDVSSFLASALTPPESLAVDGAMNLLCRIGALESDGLTALGRHLSMIPADLRCGKLMVYGATFGCFEACLTIAAILTLKSPFVSPQNKRDESKAARSSFAPNQGDLLCDLRSYEAWSKMKSQSNFRDLRVWCEQNFLSSQTLNDISSNRSQYLSSLQNAGFLPTDYRSDRHTSLNAHNSSPALIRALVAGSFYPQIARIDFPNKKFATSSSGAIELDPEARTIKFFNQDNGRVFVHPSSTLFDAQGFVGNAVYMSYFNKMATSKVFLRELTPFNAYTLLLFGGGPIVLDTLGRGLVMDGWLRLRGWARIGVLVSRLRMILDEALAKKIEDPGMDITGSEIVGIVRRLVELDGMDR